MHLFLCKLAVITVLSRLSEVCFYSLYFMRIVCTCPSIHVYICTFLLSLVQLLMFSYNTRHFKLVGLNWSNNFIACLQTGIPTDPWCEVGYFC